MQSSPDARRLPLPGCRRATRRALSPCPRRRLPWQHCRRQLLPKRRNCVPRCVRLVKGLAEIGLGAWEQHRQLRHNSCGTACSTLSNWLSGVDQASRQAPDHSRSRLSSSREQSCASVRIGHSRCSFRCLHACAPACMCACMYWWLLTDVARL